MNRAKQPKEGKVSRKSILPFKELITIFPPIKQRRQGGLPLSRFLPRQPVRESAHWAASGVFHPDAAQRAPVPVLVGARGLLPVSDT